MNWFDVDKEGLAAILERRGKEFALYELVQNAWDSGATRVEVALAPVAGKSQAVVIVEDDSPEGFADLSLAFTLFGRSTSAPDPEKRGRFCVGDKLVLALCEEAAIYTTKGTVVFDKDGRRVLEEGRDRGSIFYGVLRMTRREIEEAKIALLRLLPPIETIVNKTTLPVRTPIVEFEATLPTEHADDEGIIRRRTRETKVRVYEPEDGEVATLYELGIPVVETGDRYHVEVLQKVPLNSDRDNVTPGFLRLVRTLVLNETADRLSDVEATAPWVRDASGDERVDPEALRRVMTLRFGEKRVIADPSDPEGTKIAVSRGYTVVSGGSLSSDEWARVRENEVMRPAGQVTPSPKPYGEGGIELTEVEPNETQARVVEHAKGLAVSLLGRTISVRLVRSRLWMAAATYGPGELTINVAKFNSSWWEDVDAVNRLLIHEFGHEYCGDHLSSDYHEALCKLGARLARLALDRPFEVAL